MPAPQIVKLTATLDDGTTADLWTAAPTPVPTPTPQPPPPPTPVPTPVPPPPTPVPPPVIVVTDPDLPPDAIKVEPGQAVQAAIDIAAPLGGKTIALRRGAQYAGSLTIGRGNNLTICGYGDPKLPPPLIVSTPDANCISIPKEAQLKGLTLRNLMLRPPDRDPANRATFRLTAKGDGIWVMGQVDGLTLDNVDVAYFRQNVALDSSNNPAGCSDVLITGLRTAYAWAVPTPDNANPYLGQGLYLDCPRGPVTIRDSAFVHNGWHEVLPAKERSQFRHGLYVQRTSAAPQISGCGFIDNAAFGAQLRPGGPFDACYAQGNAFAFAGFKPQWAVTNSAILATGGRQWDGGGWIGNGGLYSWADTLNAADTVLVYVGQTAPDPKQNQFDAAAITLSRDYKAHPDWASAAPKLAASGLTVRGFAQYADFPGARDADPAKVAASRAKAGLDVGVTVKQGAAARPGWVDSAGADLLAGKTTVADLISKAKALAAA